MRRVFILLSFLVLGLIVTACDTSTATIPSTVTIPSNAATIRSAVTSKGYETGKAVDPTTAFSPSDIPIHAVVEVGNAPADTKGKVVWTSVDTTDSGGTQYKDQKIDEKEVLTKETNSTVDFTLSNDQPWPVGKYKADIYLDDKLDRTLEFEVKE